MLSCAPTILLVPVRDGAIGQNVFVSLTRNNPSATVTVTIGGETELGPAHGWSQGLKNTQPHGTVVFID